MVDFGNRSRHSIKEKIIKDQLLPYACDECHIDEWQGQKLSLHLDHINGINNDNRLNNLRFLCPNCHSLTDTYCGNNNQQAYTSINHKVSDDVILDHMMNQKDPYNALKAAGLAGAGNFQRVYRLAEIHGIEHMKHRIKQATIHQRSCLTCSADFETKVEKQLHCSHACAMTTVVNNRDDLIQWTTEELHSRWIANDRNYLKTAREAGISDSGLRRRFQKAGIRRMEDQVGFEPT